MIKFLFFIEREFHISLFENIIAYILQKNIGKIGILTLPYREFATGSPSIGCRKSFIEKKISGKFDFIDDPYQYSPDITFIADSSYEKIEGLGKIVNIGHGTISKGSFYLDSAKTFRENCADLLLVPGKIHKEVLQKNITIPIEVVGIPKLDHLFDNSLNREKILKRFNLDSEFKTVLFAPTFNKELSVLTFLDKDLREIIPEYFNIIIKLHGVTDKKYRDYFKKYALTNKNIYFSEDYNITENIFVSDLLITDISSVIYEFLSTGKPILLFDSPLQKQFKNHNENSLEYVYRDVGYRFSDLGKIPELIFRALTSSKKDYSKIADNFVSHTAGHSSKTVVEKALNLLNKKNEFLLILKGTDNLQFFVDKYQSKFDLMIYDSNTGFNEFFLKNESLIKKYKLLVLMDSRLKYSPLFPTLLTFHLKKNTEVKISCPFNRKKNSKQNIDKLIPEVQKVPNERIGAPLTYLYSGKEMKIDYFEQEAFAVDVKKLSEIISVFKDDIFDNWKSFLNLFDSDEKILAQDCFLWKS